MLHLLRRDAVTAVLASMASVYTLMLLGITIHALTLILVVLNIGLVFHRRNYIPRAVFGGKKSSFMYVLVAASLIVVMLGLSRLDMLWDEYAHWGYSIRYLVEVGRMPEASLPPVGHGAPWYPWGMAIYSVAISFPFSGLAFNAPVVVNVLLILLLAAKLSDVLALRGDQRSVSMTLMTALLGWQHSAFLLSGYADPSLSLACLLVLIYCQELLKSDLKAKDWVGFGASLILVVSLKESGKYLAIVLLASTLPLLYYHRDKVLRSIFFLHLLLVATVVLSLVWIWEGNVAQFSSSSGREIGLWFWENVAVSGEFFRAGLRSVLLSHPSLYLLPILLSLIGLIAASSRIGKASEVPEKPLIRSLVLLALLNLAFVVAAFYLSFGTGEFRVAASFARYAELSSSAALIAAYLWTWPKLKAVYSHRWMKIVVTVVMILFVNRLYQMNHHLFVAPDPQLRTVAQKIEELLQDRESPYYLDHVTSGLSPIMINWYLERRIALYYGVSSFGSAYELPEGVAANARIRNFVFIEKSERSHCYLRTTDMQELNDKNTSDVFYVFGPLSQLPNFINGRTC